MVGGVRVAKVNRGGFLPAGVFDLLPPPVSREPQGPQQKKEGSSAPIVVDESQCLSRVVQVAPGPPPLANNLLGSLEVPEMEECREEQEFGEEWSQISFIRNHLKGPILESRMSQ